jgi:hypothetical protein
MAGMKMRVPHGSKRLSRSMNKVVGGGLVSEPFGIWKRKITTANVTAPIGKLM